MRIEQNNLTIFVGGEGTIPAGEKQEQGQKKSIFVGKLSDPIEERIEQKREAARKQAAKVLQEQFAVDKDIEESINTRRERKKELLAEKKEIENSQKEAEKQLEVLKQQEPASEEERKELETKILEQQKAFLGYGFEVWQKGEEIREVDIALRQTKIDMLQYHGMVDATKSADSIIENASEQITGMLMQEAKDHVDKELEEKVEKAKEKAEEKEVQEEKLEKTKEKKEEAEALTEAIQEGGNEQVKIDQELKQILKESELLEEEMKGLIVDSGV